LLLKSPDFELTACGATFEEVRDTACDHAADVALIDLDGVGIMGLGAPPMFHRLWLRARIVGLYHNLSAAAQRDLTDRGVSMFFDRALGVEALLDALRAAAARPRLLDLNGQKPVPAALLSGREREVLQLVARGATIRQIAGHLSISSKTVGNHKQRIFLKLGVRNQAHAVAVGLGEGWLDGNPLDVRELA
jgi:DNA-binding NarL/FixJ family response regulator